MRLAAKRPPPSELTPPTRPCCLQVPREDEYLAVLHITPLRASRPLALRYLSQKLALQQDNVVVMALAPETTGSVEGGDLVAGSYCSDTQDLVGGMQQVCAVAAAVLGGGGSGGR